MAHGIHYNYSTEKRIETPDGHIYYGFTEEKANEDYLKRQEAAAERIKQEKQREQIEIKECLEDIVQLIDKTPKRDYKQIAEVCTTLYERYIGEDYVVEMFLTCLNMNQSPYSFIETNKPTSSNWYKKPDFDSWGL